jgi:hypothetical protein
VWARRSGLWIAAADDLWQWQVSLRRVSACDPVACAKDDTVCKPLRPEVSAALVADAAWQSLRQSRRVAIGVPLGRRVAVDLAAAGLGTDLVPLAGLGERVVVRQDLRVRPCGQADEQQSWKAALVHVPQGTLGPLAATVQGEGLLAADGGSAAPVHEFAELTADVRWLAVQQRLTPEGWWQFSHVRLLHAGESDVLDEVPAVALPSSLAEAVRDAPQLTGLPADEREALARLLVSAGWSWVRGEQASRQALLARFRGDK